MKPSFKYSGGKFKELKRIDELIKGVPIDRVIEPFSGCGAFSWHMEKPSIVSDIRKNNIDTFLSIKDKKEWKELYKNIKELKDEYDIKKLEKIYYYWRDEKFNNCNSLWESGFRWIVLRQLCFSGMDRVNKKQGKFNVPFGWYKKFTCNISEEHHKLIQKWEIYNKSFDDILLKTKFKENDFLFLDPPYLGRNSDYGDTHNLNLHNELYDILCKTKTKWLLIHCDDEFYRKKYINDSFHSNIKEFSYSSQWKGREQKNRNTNHLYITNFKV